MSDNQAYKTIVTGEVGGTSSAERLPDVPCSKVNIRAVQGNSGNVYLGGASTLTIADGGTDATTGFQLDAGQETGWLELSNLNQLYMICDNPGDDIVYMVLR